METSSNGLQFIQNEEGCVLHVYKDQAGLPTVGIGHLLTGAEKATGFVNIAGQKVELAHGITKDQALDLLAQDVKPAESAVNAAVTVPLTQNQFDALVSFTFNVGCGGFRSSTALKMVNSQQFDQVPQWLAKWDKADGKVCPTLVGRRKREADLFLS